jgi:putative ABC transport system permease protein
MIMVKYHLLIAIRNLKKYKGSFLINLIGLSTGMACAFLIYLWVNDELNFDKFHAKEKQLYQVMELSTENGNVLVHEGTQGPLAEAMRKDLPEVEIALPVLNLSKEGMTFSVKAGDKIVKANGIFAGNQFFNTFSFPLISGNKLKVLEDKSSIVITENLAKNLFGSTEQAMGKIIEWELAGLKMQTSVTGVAENTPQNSSLGFDIVMTFDALQEKFPNVTKWWNEGTLTYLVLKEGTDIKAFNAKINGFINSYHPNTIFSLFVRPYSSAYLYGKYENGVQSGGRISYVNLFSIIAVFILIIACINFMNLATAKASRRLKEVGIKKAVGSSRMELILQFLSEAVLVAFLSLFAAAILVVILSPAFNAITGKTLSIPFNVSIAATCLVVTLVTGLIAGSYPAFYLSSFNPVEVLKGKVKNSIGELIARKGLVIFQLVVSLVFIIAVLVIQSQVEYAQSKNLGYDKSNVLYFDKEGALQTNSSAYFAGLRKIPGVLNASSIAQSVVQNTGNSSTYGISWPGKSDKDLTNFIVREVDYNLLETLGIQVISGRSFSPDFGSDSSGLIFNETAIKMMGLKNPVGTPIVMWGKNMQIIGVVKDFHISSLHQEIAPIVFRYEPNQTLVVMAKIAAGKEKETISAIETFTKNFNPGYPINFNFLDEAYQALYVAEQRISSLSKYFAGLAILISFLGLFGLAAYNAEVRTKEIGIRKVLGASVSNVVLTLSTDFFKLLIPGVFIAFPLAWFGMNKWLDGFAYKTSIGAGVFLIALLAIFIVTLAAVSFQAIKAALANPVKSLRTE